MATTHHSEYGNLRSVFLKRPEQAFVNDKQVDEQWKELNFLSKPDLAMAVAEYRNFENLVAASGAHLYFLPADPAVTMDSIYCRDAAIATDYGMVICNMGKPARIPEPAAEQREFERLNIPILGVIQAPGTLEGGDVAWIDRNTLAVGHTYRTNEEGIRQLKHLLQPFGITVLVAHMPHYKGPSDVFHLMSVFSPVDKNLAVVYSPLMPIAFRNGLLDRGYSFIEVPDSEWDSMGCNVLALSPRECIMVSGNPVTRQRLEGAGCRVHLYNGNEISIKGGGGPTCLTRPLLREIL
ncbi:MAG: arginine deiminase family protein [Cyclobacteriaceae bacterium]|nr:arginine deiminase family protein [Cyclobacteriaceae bacterium]